MSRSFVVTTLLCFAALSGCAPLSLYYKPGAEVSRMQADSLACETAALRDAPVANQIRQRPPVYYPGRQYCNGGHCYYHPGYYMDGGYYTVDVNRDLRRRVEQSCMAQKGYQPVEIKRCTSSVALAAGGGATTRLPPLSAQSCAIQHDDGTFLIVEPG